MVNFSLSNGLNHLNIFYLFYIFLADGFLGVGYQEHINPDSEELGFSSEQFEIIYFLSYNENTSSIFLPSKVILNSEGNITISQIIFYKLLN